MKSSHLENGQIRTRRNPIRACRSCLNKGIRYKRIVTIHEPLPDAGASGSKFHEIITKLRNAMEIGTAIGYQDESGFYMGVKPVENKIKWPSVW
jgi:hypothetical protein